MSDEEFLSFTPDDKIKIADAIDLIKDSMIRIEAERDYIKDTLKDLKDKYKLPSTTVRKVATYRLNEEKKMKADQETDLIEYLLDILK
jgi:hypothetical protein